MKQSPFFATNFLTYIQYIQTAYTFVLYQYGKQACYMSEDLRRTLTHKMGVPRLRVRGFKNCGTQTNKTILAVVCVRHDD